MADEKENENKPKAPRVVIRTVEPKAPVNDTPDAEIVDVPKPEGRKMAKDSKEGDK